MLETALKSMTTFFATIGPVEASVLFAMLTPNVPFAERRAIAVRASVIATAILAFFTLLGGPILHELGVTIPALQTAGGIILLLIGIDMTFARPGGAIKLTPPEGAEAQSRDDVAVFPLATPLLAGPGAMSAGILLAANSQGQPLGIAVVMASLIVVMLLTCSLLVAAHQLNRLMGVTAQRVLIRVFGILLAAIAVQAVFNGVKGAGIFAGAVLP